MHGIAKRLGVGTWFLLAVLAGCGGGGGSDAPKRPAAPAAPAAILATPGDGQVTLSWGAVGRATSFAVYWSTNPGVSKSSGTKVAGVTSPWTHAGRTNGTTYYYVVTAANEGGESRESPQASAVPSANPAPAAPAGVTAASGDGQVTITWPPVAGATSYTIYWSTSAGVTKGTGTALGGVTSPYVHTARTNGTTYHYVVTASNANGESVDSNEVSATPWASGGIPPGAPTGLVATAGDGSVTLSWNAVSGATSYNLYVSDTAGVPLTPANRLPGVTRPYVQTGLWNGTTFHYVVTALNAYGESPASAEVSATPIAAGYSVSGTLTGGGSGRVYLVADNGAYGAPFTCGTSITAPGAFTIRGIPPGTYTIRAFQDALGYAEDNAQFPHWASDPVQVTTASLTGVTLSLLPSSSAVPTAPTSLTVTPGDGAAFVQWSPNLSSGYVESATGYDVAWGPDAAASTSGRSLDARMAPNLLLELPNLQSFYFRVRARVGASASAWSTTVGPVTIGAAAGGHTISGTATLPVDATGPLYLLVCDEYATTCRLGHVASPARSQPYTVTGVPDGTYFVDLVVDQDQAGTLDLGDLLATYSLAVAGADRTKDVTFPATSDARVAAPTTRMRWVGAFDEYWRTPSVEDDRKRVVATTLTAARGLTVPIDLARKSGKYGGTWLSAILGSPTPGEALGFALTYADGSTAAVSLPAAALDFARDLTVTPTPSAVVPTFSWAAPATPPAGTWGYTFGVNGGSTSWGCPSWDPFMPTTQLAVVYDADGTASSPALTAGQQYTWSVGVVDLAGNSATAAVTYTPPP
jgi:fibronectin type 3 domain-containing protein